MSIRRLPSRFALALLLALVAVPLSRAAEPITTKVTEAKDIIGFNFGDDYCLANYTQLSACLKQWARESNRVTVVSIGTTEEGRPQYMAIITSAENHKHLDHYREISHKLSMAEGLTDEQAHALAKEGKTIAWIDGGLHSTETANWTSLGEMVYQMASRNDDETLRFLDDVILLMPIPNPDGVELVANWYMREADPKKRTYATLPRLYAKYVGHDNNRDSMMDNMKETTNQNRVMFVEWMPQIMLNTHQVGPAGAVVFVSPFRDPFNYNFDSLIPIGVENLGTFMHQRLVSRGMGGSAMRSEAPYSTWFNGGMRTAVYFHNQIGILTEIIGSPTPITVPLLAEQQLPTGDLPLPVAPQVWHFRRTIEYMIELERAVVDYGSRNREILLYDIYGMGKRSIERGSRDSWTITPTRIAALAAAAKAAKGEVEMDEMMRMMVSMGMAKGPIPTRLYQTILHDPKFRDPRVYIISKDQDDYPTAVKFVDVLQKQGITVLKATADFEAEGKHYPAGSYVVKTAQAYRPEILDFFEPQDHPTDYVYPGGPPRHPYDITGWTISAQMGVKVDRLYTGLEGPFEALPVLPLEKPPVFAIKGVAKPAGYLLSHRVNDSFIAMNRLLKAGAEVDWLKDEQTIDGKALGTGTIWVPASPQSTPIIERAAQELGVPAYPVAQKPVGESVRLKPIRIGLVDLYGGNMPSGWLRWMMERYEFPFEVVFPQVLDAGNLKANFDVIVFPSDTYSSGARGGGRRGGPNPQTIPEEFRSMLGSISNAKTIPPLKTFVEEGGTLLALGSSAVIGEAMGLPVTDHLVEKGPDGKVHKLSQDKFYVPGSVLEVAFNNRDPLAYGMPDKGYVFFDSSPVFDRKEDSSVKASKVAWFDEKYPLYSGWALGQPYLQGGELATEAQIGKGHLVLIGFEATFRGTPHAMFKLFFNGLYLGAGTPDAPATAAAPAPAAPGVSQ
jgi:hypothetical protein